MTNELGQDISNLEKSLLRMDQATKTFVPPKFFNELHNHNGSSTPHRLLDITEILERIFLLCDIQGLLILRQVNRNFRDVIAQSSGLQRALFLKADISRAFDMPASMENLSVPDNLPRLKTFGVPHIDESGVLTSQTNVRVNLQCGDGFDRFTISPLYRRMLVCQPPVKKLTIDSLSCCGARRDILRTYFESISHDTELEVDTGVRVGDVYDAAEAEAIVHRLCPLASVEMMNDDGIVHPDVKYSGFVAATVSSRMSGSHGYVSRVQPRRAERERSKKKKAQLLAYKFAKMLGAYDERMLDTVY
jgi:hypothetical protein